MTELHENQLASELQQLTAELREELHRLNVYANRGDSLAVASVAYRMRHLAQTHGLKVFEEGASRIEDSARKDNAPAFLSEIQLLGHQLRWHSMTSPQPF